MTFEQLQKYLDEDKWIESSLRGVDMCGRYARCRYCDRGASYPCARAHNKLIEMRSASVPDAIPSWLLSEPPVKKKFGTEIATEPPMAPMSEGKRKWTKWKAPVSEASAAESGGEEEKNVRLFVLRKKRDTRL